MEIKNRLFPYPVLCAENDDYENCEFDVNVKVKDELNDIVIDFDIKLEGAEELQWQIRDGFAEYVIHIECSSTAFRTIVTASGNKKSFRISKSKVNNEITLLGMVVAKKDITVFKCKNLNEDYSDESVSFSKGAILAYRNLPKVFITKDYEELAGDNSFFTVVKRTDGEQNGSEPVVYDLSDAKIKIIVNEYIYNEYIKYHDNMMMSPLTNTLLVMPAIVHMIDELRNNGSESYKPLQWYQKISKSCKLKGKDFENDILDSEMTCMEIAQEMMQFPIGRAFECLSRVIEE